MKIITKMKMYVQYNDGVEVWISPVLKDSNKKDCILVKILFNNQSIYIKLPEKKMLKESMLRNNQIIQRVLNESEVIIKASYNYKNNILLSEEEITERRDIE